MKRINSGLLTAGYRVSRAVYFGKPCPRHPKVNYHGPYIFVDDYKLIYANHNHILSIMITIIRGENMNNVFDSLILSYHCMFNILD